MEVVNKGEKKRTIPGLAHDTKMIIERLRKVSPGEEVAYEEINKLVGRNVQNGARSNLLSARRYVERESQIVFGVVFGKGLKRLLNHEIPYVADQALARVGRLARRTGRSIDCVDFDALTEKDRVAHNARKGVLAVLAHGVRTTTMQRIEGAVANANGRQLPEVKVIAEFYRS